MRIRLAVRTLSSLWLVACGGGGRSPGVDADVTVDPDARGDAAFVDAPSIACTVSTASFGDKGALTAPVVFDSGQDEADATDDVLRFNAPLEAGAPTDVIQVLLFAGYGVFAGTAITPGTYAITGDELNFATCGVCILVSTNVTANGQDDTYIATGGTVTITAAGTALGQELSGSLASITLHHAEIDPNTAVSTLSPDDCTTSVTSATFSGTLAN